MTNIKNNHPPVAVLSNCFWFTCDSCNVINICPMDAFESLYICDHCGNQLQITKDECTFEGIQINTEPITRKDLNA